MHPFIKDIFQIIKANMKKFSEQIKRILVLRHYMEIRCHLKVFYFQYYPKSFFNVSFLFHPILRFLWINHQD